MTHRKLNRVLEGIVIGLTVPTFAFAATGMTSSEYSAAKDRAAAEYKAAKTQCDGLKANAKDVCVAEAKAAEKKAKANAEAQYKNTEKARQDAAITAAKADYDVAKEKCDDRKGNDKDVCVKEAKAVETKAIADAKSAQKVASVREDAREDKMKADYKVAMEKCDALSGAAKDSCQNAAKAKYKM
jgi:hypothetical protein